MIFPFGLEGIVHDLERSAYVEPAPPYIQVAMGSKPSAGKNQVKNNSFFVEDRLSYINSFYLKAGDKPLDEKTIRDTLNSLSGESDLGKNLIRVYNSGEYGRTLVEKYLKEGKNWEEENGDYSFYKKCDDLSKEAVKKYKLPTDIEREIRDGLAIGTVRNFNPSLIALERKLNEVKTSILDDVLYEVIRRLEKGSKFEDDSDINNLHLLARYYTFSLIKQNLSEGSLKEWLNELGLNAEIELKYLNAFEKQGFEKYLNQYQEKNQPKEKPVYIEDAKIRPTSCSVTPNHVFRKPRDNLRKS